MIQLHSNDFFYVFHRVLCQERRDEKFAQLLQQMLVDLRAGKLYSIVNEFMMTF